MGTSMGAFGSGPPVPIGTTFGSVCPIVQPNRSMPSYPPPYLTYQHQTGIQGVNNYAHNPPTVKRRHKDPDTFDGKSTDWVDNII